MPAFFRSKSMPSSSAQANRCSRAAIARRAVSVVLWRYWEMDAMNSANQESLCQLGLGLTSNGASLLSIHFMPLTMVDQWFQTSAFDAESWPPLANEVSIAA